MKIRVPVDAPYCAPYLTRGKVYEVGGEDANKYGGDIVDDVGDVLSVFIPGSAHLGGGPFDVVEEDA